MRKLRQKPTQKRSYNGQLTCTLKLTITQCCKFDAKQRAVTLEAKPEAKAEAKAKAKAKAKAEANVEANVSEEKLN